MQDSQIDIDIVSDVVCPWCVIGYGRLRQAMASRQASFSIRWHPFELNPKMPPGGQNLREHLHQKYGTTLEGSIAARKRLTGLGAEVGFTFDYADDMRIYNTFEAHQLMALAEEKGLQTELAMALFEAFFTRREAIDEIGVLSAVAARIGLDEEEVSAVLTEQRFASEVRLREGKWLDQGISGVPAFIFDNRFLITGAQDVSIFGEVLDKLIAHRSVPA